MVLSCQAGIGQISFDVRPVAQAVVVEYFQIVGNDEGYIVIPKAFTKHNQPSYTPVSVLEGVDGFEALMKVQNIFKCRLLSTKLSSLYECLPAWLYCCRPLHWGILCSLRLETNLFVRQMFRISK